MTTTTNTNATHHETDDSVIGRRYRVASCGGDVIATVLGERSGGGLYLVEFADLSDRPAKDERHGRRVGMRAAFIRDAIARSGL